jgi:hypothetical protein
MDWTSLRKKFESPHIKVVKYKGTKGCRLENATYAFLYNEDSEKHSETGILETDERIEIELFEKEIITYYPDGDFGVNNHGYWQSPTTKDRYRRYLPWSGHITSWRFTEFDRAFQHRGTRRYVWTLWLSGAGTHPWRNNIRYNSSGPRRDLSKDLNETDANELVHKVQVFSKKALDELYAGGLSMENTCFECELLLRDFAAEAPHQTMNKALKHRMQNHFKDHVLENVPSFPLLVEAADIGGGERDKLAAELMAKENHRLWRTPKNNRERAERVQRLFLEPTLSMDALGAHPSHYKKRLRWLLEEYLLVTFGFELGQ